MLISLPQAYTTTMNACHWTLRFKKLTDSFFNANDSELLHGRQNLPLTVFHFNLKKEKVMLFCDLRHTCVSSLFLFKFKGKENCVSRQKARPDQSCTLKPPFLSYSCFRILLLPLFPIIFFCWHLICISLTLRWCCFFFPSYRPEKMAKLPVILGNLDVTIDNVSPDFPSKY